MHTLTLLRHAKSDKSAHVSDKDRPLNEKGFYDAPIVAKRVHEYGRKPDKMISSYALRAETTAQIFADALGATLILDKALYNVDEESVMSMIRTTDEEVEDLLLVGHNPTWELLAESLTQTDISMPACAVVQISFECAWKNIDKGSGKIIYFDYPKKETQ